MARLKCQDSKCNKLWEYFEMKIVNIDKNLPLEDLLKNISIRHTSSPNVTKEILINPEIASFFIKIKRVFFPKENSGAQLDVIEKEFHMAGEEPPAYITKMISNIMGYQFNILNDFVHKKLSEIKKTESSKEGM